MELALWFIIGALFLLSLVGVVIPVIPDALLIWLAFLIYQFGIDNATLGWTFWVPMTILTLFIIGADMLSNIYFVKKYGGDKWSMMAAVAGILLGPFVLGLFLGPLSIVVGPFVAVFLVQLVRGCGAEKSFRIALGTLLGFLSSTIAKIIIQLIMMIWFFIVVL
ncbi:DUF456 family protein [Aneurinibacillus thermoaerophilus]|uniref:DUF456 family protein n=1 Tax=Aneurinibacillus thermoaerophilus TaxID=143495 RepID=A0ABX8YGI9_ANETH|nr:MULTISPECIES: DUF456 family protein [Aneurinibacillus]AMA73121.1 hypothetical protein ACH33_09780 [Aneurinibacillus sp. XH2]MED0674467.1 DUF456 family protein [Aneurinibacillus thermoaerophilus]MED0678485.1 DUF456 family protein [Aneurinibacillus thermoaerophilus]MED0759094.1 DUF456 family protein [Aneurinibacillus thermoaerophilus]MED0762604.1 DUF456 family protein [Aneurinibacillus thermoaerophilus]